MYLSLVLKILFIFVSQKVVDTIVIVDEEEILELTSWVLRDDNFFFNNNFTLFDWAKFINYCNIYRIFMLQTDMQVPFNVEVAEEISSQYMHFFVVYLLFSNFAIILSDTYSVSNFIFYL